MFVKAGNNAPRGSKYGPALELSERPDCVAPTPEEACLAAADAAGLDTADFTTVLVGTAGADAFDTVAEGTLACGLAGNDTVVTNFGAFLGHNGDDAVVDNYGAFLGQDGADLVLGYSNGYVEGGPGDDRFVPVDGFTFAGNEGVFVGGDGADTVHANFFDGRFYGGDGDDRMQDNGGLFEGEAGDDSVHRNLAGATFDGGADTDGVCIGDGTLIDVEVLDLC